MRIIDAQIHLWQGCNAPAHHCLGRSTFSYGDALAGMDEAGVDAAINCPPIWDEGASAYAMDAVTAHPDRFATLDWLDLTDNDARERVPIVAGRPGVLGLRFLTASPRRPSDPTDKFGRFNWPNDGRYDWLWEDCEALSIPVCLFGPALAPRIRGIAERYPSLKITIDHYGVTGPVQADGVLGLMDGLAAMARLPNVSLKLTGGPSLASDAYPFRSLEKTTRLLFDLFGPERLFWGTDITRLETPWRQCITMFTEETNWLSPADLRLIMGEAFARWFNWKRLP